MTKLQAAFAIQAINVEFCLEIYQIFKGVTGVQEIADLIAIGVLSRHLSQMLMVWRPRAAACGSALSSF